MQSLTEAEIAALKRDMRESLAQMQAILRQRHERQTNKGPAG